jgi:transcriptional regulator with XRE-family HTH domain
LRKQRTGKVDPKSHAAFSDRLRIALDNAGASILSIAQSAGVSDSTIHLWLKGSEPSREKIIALAGATKVSLEWLATGAGEMRSDGPEGYIVPSWPRDRAPVLFELDWFRKNFGRAIVPQDIKEGLGSKEAEQFLAPLLFEMPADDSMQPTLRKGDLLLARQTGIDSPVNGLYLVARKQLKPDQLWLFPRRVEWSGHSIAILKCDNPAYPAVIEVSESNESGFFIYGRVIWHGRTV